MRKMMGMMQMTVMMMMVRWEVNRQCFVIVICYFDVFDIYMVDGLSGLLCGCASA